MFFARSPGDRLTRAASVRVPERRRCPCESRSEAVLRLACAVGGGGCPCTAAVRPWEGEQVPLVSLEVELCFRRAGDVGRRQQWRDSHPLTSLRTSGSPTGITLRGRKPGFPERGKMRNNPKVGS